MEKINALVFLIPVILYAFIIWASLKGKTSANKYLGYRFSKAFESEADWIRAQKIGAKLSFIPLVFAIISVFVVFIKPDLFFRFLIAFLGLDFLVFFLAKFLIDKN